ASPMRRGSPCSHGIAVSRNARCCAGSDGHWSRSSTNSSDGRLFNRRLTEQLKHEATPVQGNRNTVQGDAEAEPVTPLGFTSAEPHQQRADECRTGSRGENERESGASLGPTGGAKEDCAVLCLAESTGNPAA